MTNTQKLLQLAAENPNLPIVPMVDYDVVGDGYGFWLGEFGHCEVGEYTLYKERYYDDREEFNDAYYCGYTCPSVDKVCTLRMNFTQ